MDSDNIIDFISESFDTEIPSDNIPPCRDTDLLGVVKEAVPSSTVKAIPLAAETPLPPIAPYLPASTNAWDPRMVLDLAIGVDDIDEILVRYDLSHSEFNILTETASFRRDLAQAMKDVRDNGVSFSAKAKVQAESYLEVLDNLVYDIETPAGVRLDAIKSTVKWGGLEPKDDKGSSENTPQVNVQINF